MSIVSLLKDNPLIQFSISAVVLTVAALLFSSLIVESYIDFYKDMGNSYFKDVNNDYTYQRKVEIKSNPENIDELKVFITFYDKKNPDGTLVQKFVGVNIYNEAMIPTILVLVLIASLPVSLKRKLISFGFGFVIVNLFIFFKLYAIAFDNYNSPEFVIYELPAVISSIVYFYNYFLNVTGYGFNLVMSVLIVLVSSVKISDIEYLRAKLRID